jgi:hypothetical protein
MKTAIVNLDTNTAGVSMTKKKTWLQTFSGRRVCVEDPETDEIYLEDILVALPKLCRFNGHCKDFYSVAQHCVLGAEFALEWFNKDVAKEFLLHDATETYVGDTIRPIKRTLNKRFPGYEDVEKGFWRAISYKFNIPLEHSEACQHIDNVMLTWEKRDLLPNSEEWPNLPDIRAYNLPTLTGWTWEKAESEYRNAYNKLFLQ